MSNSNDPFTTAFNTLAQAQLEKYQIPGAALSVVSDDQTWSKGFGLADLATKLPVQPAQTLFYTGSTTKAFLCAAWAQHIHSQPQPKPHPHPPAAHNSPSTIGWGTRLADLLPHDWRLKDAAHGARVTLEDVLCHRSGLGGYSLAYGQEGVRGLREVVGNLRDLEVSNPPGSRWEYSNLGYAAAGLALEEVMGRPLGAVLRDGIWAPLGMESTFAGTEAERKENLARGYSWSKWPGEDGFDQGQHLLEPYMNLDLVSGAGYMVSTAADYAKWMRCLLSGSPPLSPQITKDLCDPRAICPASERTPTPFDGDILLYALGWWVASYHGRRVMYHSGGLRGFGSRVVLVPEIRWGACFMANTMDSGFLLTPLLFTLLDAALDLPAEKRTGAETYQSIIPKIYAPLIDKDTAFRRLYPHAPTSPSVAYALPLSEYAGRYYNRAYGTLAFAAVAGEGHLSCALEDRTWSQAWTIRHVNAELWVAEADRRGFGALRKAESRIGPGGGVEGFWVAMEMGDVLVWFEKVGTTV